MAAIITVILMSLIICDHTRALDFDVRVDLSKTVAVTNEKFVSVTIDSVVLLDNWATFNPSLPEVFTLARALSPAYLRIGGTWSDTLIFERSQKAVREPTLLNVTFTAEDWDKLNTFAIQSNLSLIFGLNSLYRPGVAWDPDNAKALMQYSADRGYVLDLELGNEPDVYTLPVYNRSVEPQQLGQDFGMLRRLMDSMSSFKSRHLFGPDTSNDFSDASKSYLKNFVKSGSEFVNAVTYHHYYEDGRRAKMPDFTNTDILDSLKSSIETVKETVQNFSRGTQQYWLGETSSMFAGGVPGLSDSYLAGFMWLDKLGISALNSVGVVMRQAFVGSNYGLVDFHNGVYTPNPDYWLTVLYKRLVGETVLRTGETGEKLRVYSHCTNTRAGYPHGAVTFYMMNLYNTSVNLNFSQFRDSDLHIYLLTSGDDHTLASKKVRLNGNGVQLVSGQLPPLPPVVRKGPSVEMAPMSFGFVVIPDANTPLCMN